MQNHIDFDPSPISPDQRKKTSKGISFKERAILYGAIFVFLGSLTAWAINYYVSSTEKAPAVGGEYTEGITGQPMYVNPILSQTNEVDSVLCSLIYSSLLKYDSQGNLVNDLAESYKISEDQKSYTFKIRPDVKWHDNSILTAKDIEFTIRLIQNKSYKSTLRGAWEGVSVSVVDDLTIRFQREDVFAPFLNNFTFGILPQHIFEGVAADNFPLNKFNLEPIGSGPFTYAKMEKDEKGNIISYQLLANQNYYTGRPYLEKINFNFYEDEDAIIDAYLRKEINGFGFISYDKIEKVDGRKDTDIKTLRTPRYFAVYLNRNKSVPLADKEVRKALIYATNKDAIIEQALQGKAEKIYSPVLANIGIFSPNGEIEKPDYNPEEARNILEQAGWKIQDDGTRKKDDAILEIELVSTQFESLAKSAELIKEQWEQIGIKVNLINMSISEIQSNKIRPREYQALLFGQEYLGNDPYLYRFWHSKETNMQSGNNIAMFKNDEVDKLLEETKQTSDMNKRKENYAKVEKIIAEDYAAIFLFSFNYIEAINKKIKGYENEVLVSIPSRFSDVNKWYINTKRIKKS